MADLAVDGGTLHYERTGDGDRTILWVHGLPLCGDAWAPQLVRFDTGFDNVAIDLRGYGQSSKLPGDGDVVSLYVDDLRLLLDHLGLRKVRVVGFASGGHAALTFAAQHADRVERLVLINASPRFRRTSDWPFGFDDEAVAAMHAVAARDGLMGLIDVLLAPSTVFADCAPLQAAVLQERYAAMARKAGLETLLAFFDRLALHDARPLLREVRCPTLLVSSRLGKEVPSAVALFMREQIPEAALAEIPGADHFVFATRAALVNALLDGFLA